MKSFGLCYEASGHISGLGPGLPRLPDCPLQLGPALMWVLLSRYKVS